MRSHRAVIGLVAILDVAMLVATAPADGEVRDTAEIDTFTLSADTPTLELTPVVTLGEKFDGDASITMEVHLSLENHGGAGWLSVYSDSGAPDGLPPPRPLPPVLKVQVRDGSTEPFAFDVIAYVDAIRYAELDERHLLIQLEGDAELEGTGLLVVNARVLRKHQDEYTISVEIP